MEAILGVSEVLGKEGMVPVSSLDDMDVVGKSISI